MREADFERLYQQHAQPLFGFIAYRTGDRALAEDLLADTFARALAARNRFDRRKGSEKAWLYSIALNLVRDHARRSAVAERALERVRVATGPATDSLEHAERRQLILHAVESLGEAEREVIALRYGAGLTMPEIAAVTESPLTTVEGRCRRALHHLRDELS
jgi:RNA polymerase sigma factor (sigma-70 family)